MNNGMQLAKYVVALSGTRLGRPSQVNFPPGKRMREGVLFFVRTGFGLESVILVILWSLTMTQRMDP